MSNATPGATPTCATCQHQGLFHGELKTHTSLLREVVQLLKRESRLSSLDEPAMLGATYQPHIIRPLGRHYVWVWAPAALAITIAGITDAATYNLAAGWQALNLPERTRISSLVAGNNPVIIRYTDDPFGGL